MIANRMDQVVTWTKWPAAIAAVASVPLTTTALVWQLSNSLSSPIYLVLFAAGFGLLCFAARTALSNTRWVKWMFGILHDSTQAAVAMLMFRSMKGLSQNHSMDSSRTGRISSENWIMQVSPYVVPLSTMILWTVSLVLLASLRSAVLGFGLGLHLAYVGFQWNSGTGELHRLGRRFCWMFLPAANLAIVGFVFAFAIDGFSGAWGFFYDCVMVPSYAWDYAKNLMVVDVGKGSLSD